MLLLCFGAILFQHQLAAGPEGASIAGYHLAAPMEEAEPADKQPVNAGSLTALLVTFLLASLGLLAGVSWAHRRDRVYLLVRRRLPSSTYHAPHKPPLSLLEVFRV